VKSTSRRRIDRTGDITLENDALVFALRIRHGGGGEQRL
jgi:hypothetical protein